jgi:hypothetical protein
MLVHTIKPEEIRGGGVLKYCYLIAQNYVSFDSVFLSLFLDFASSIDQKQCKRKIHNR